MFKGWRLAALAIALILAGDLTASLTQTAGGIRIEDVRFRAADGAMMSALLYVPPNATHATPAPGILAVHGYLNSRETQDGFAIEFARRGWVVLALDQTGHGYSDPPAFANGFGGPAGLAYLRSLDIVDTHNIGLEGHSMGGWAVLAAAAAMPDEYKAMVLEGSSTGAPFAAPGTPGWPRNLALVFARYEEFPLLMWGVARASDVTISPKLLTLFGAQGRVDPGRVYGDTASGTARVLYTPSITHPAEHISSDAIGDAIDWFQRNLQGGSPKPVGDQIWFAKEAGTLVAAIGFVLLLLGAFDLLLALPILATLTVGTAAATPAPRGRDARWWSALILAILIPALTYYPMFALAEGLLPASSILPQGITNQIAAWVLVNAVITAVLLLLVPAGSGRPGLILPSVVIALAAAAIGYLSLVATDLIFKTDYRFWVVGLKLMSPKQWETFPIYLIPFALFFIIGLESLRRSLHRRGQSSAAAYLTSVAALALGFGLMTAVQYGAMALDGKLIDPWPGFITNVPLNTIIAIQFVPILAVVGIIAAFTLRRTGTALPGALLCALVVTWYVVAGQPMQAVL
jgi:pimeloyl-ACP methyl ester carboxylesterase